MSKVVSGGLRCSLLVVLGLQILPAGSPAQAQDDRNLEWYQAYERGLAATDCEARIRYFELAIAKKPQPSFNARGQRTKIYDLYFPQVDLAEAYSACDDPEAAEAVLWQANARGEQIWRLLENGGRSRRHGLARRYRQRLDVLGGVLLASQRALEPSDSTAATIATTQGSAPEPTDAPRSSQPSPPPPSSPLQIASIEPDGSQISESLDTPALAPRNSENTLQTGSEPDSTAPTSPDLLHPVESGTITTTIEPGITTEEPGIHTAEPDDSRSLSVDDDTGYPALVSQGVDVVGSSQDDGSPPTHLAAPRATAEPGPTRRSLPWTLFIRLGDALEFKCQGDCAYDPDQGILTLGRKSLPLPRGYRSLVLDGQPLPCPDRRDTDYDEDLDSLEHLFDMVRGGQIHLENPQPDSALPTVWLAGHLLFNPTGAPSLLQYAGTYRLGDLSGLKVIRFRYEMNALLRSLAQTRQSSDSTR